MNVVTIVSISTYSVVVLLSFFYQKYLADVTIFVYMALGIGFFTTGIVMIVSIKKHFTEFYEKVSCALWAATILLAVPMFLRAVNWESQERIPVYLEYY
jgi:Na+/glutamate symporter